MHALRFLTLIMAHYHHCRMNTEVTDSFQIDPHILLFSVFVLSFSILCSVSFRTKSACIVSLRFLKFMPGDVSDPRLFYLQCIICFC